MTTGNDLFILDPNNRDAAMGIAPYKSRTKLVFGCITIFPFLFLFTTLCFSVGLIPFLVISWSTFSNLNERGITTQATVVDRYIEDSDDDTDYYMVYEFRYTSPSGEPGTQQGEGQIGRRAYDAVEIGQQVEIVYDPENPGVSMIGQPDMGEPIGVTVTALVFMLLLNGLAGAFAWWAWRRRQRERRLEQHGQLLRGLLTSISGKLDSDNDFEVEVIYQFMSPTGSIIPGKYQTFANHLANQPLPPTGTPVAIWYVDDKNYKLL